MNPSSEGARDRRSEVPGSPSNGAGRIRRSEVCRTESSRWRKGRRRKERPLQEPDRLRDRAPPGLRGQEGGSRSRPGSRADPESVGGVAQTGSAPPNEEEPERTGAGPNVWVGREASSPTGSGGRGFESRHVPPEPSSPGRRRLAERPVSAEAEHTAPMTRGPISGALRRLRGELARVRARRTRTARHPSPRLRVPPGDQERRQRWVQRVPAESTVTTR